MAERRLSRFTYNETTRTITAGSERIVHRFMTQVFSCCHLGGSMDFDSQGNLYFATGDNTGNSPNSNNGGYTNGHPTHTLPCTGGDPTSRSTSRPAAASTRRTRTGDGSAPGAHTLCRHTDTATADHRARCAACGYISYADARQTSGNTNAFEGKLLRIKPVATLNADTAPGLGTTYTDPRPRRPERPEPVPADSQAVTDGKAKPEIFAMGVRNLYSIDVDEKTDKISAAWVGPDQGTNSPVWGPAKTENAVQINSAGNYGWPFCTGNQQGYRAKLPAATGGGIAAPVGHPAP